MTDILTAEQVEAIRDRHSKATPAILGMHQEMLDICQMDFSDRDAAWFRVWIAEWFNTIKQFWPFDDIPALLAALDAANAAIVKGKHGRWIPFDEGNPERPYNWTCSACGNGCVDHRTAFCNDCGSKMDVPNVGQ